MEFAGGQALVPQGDSDSKTISHVQRYDSLSLATLPEN
jgi:hypothetical protein